MNKKLPKKEAGMGYTKKPSTHRFKNDNKCWRCGFEGQTHWHHFNPPCWYEVEELCSMCHYKVHNKSPSRRSLKKKKVDDLVKGLKNG